MKGVRKTSLLYIIPLIAILAIPMLCWNVYAQQYNSGGTEVIWGHIYPPSGGTYHYHTVGYFAWSAEWRDTFSGIGDGYIYMGGTEGTTSWYCGGQQWWSQPNQIMYNIKVIKIKDLTNQTEYTDPNVIYNNHVYFWGGYVKPQGSQYVDTIVDLLWAIVQTKTGFSFPNPFKLISGSTNVGSSYNEITVYGSGSLSEFFTFVKFNYANGFTYTHTYEVTCRLTWIASFSIWVEGGLQGRNPIEGEDIISPESGQAVDIAYAAATIDIKFIVTP
ncbi:MAG: hypothetical protein NDF57_04830 [archaeon GBS-70-058]|nr:hypothetical protein [Candidatus Culexarchaeum nevadense]